jgi:hypothetical protein
MRLLWFRGHNRSLTQMIDAAIMIFRRIEVRIMSADFVW